MKCPWCSAENALGTEECVSCGRALFLRNSNNMVSDERTTARHESRRCTACGRPIDWDVNHCPYCGHNFRLQQRGTSPVPGPQASSSTSVGMIVAAIVIAFVIIIVIIIVLAIAIPGIVGSKATINIRVYSTHILFSINYDLYVDGSLVDSDTLSAGYYAQYSYVYEWSSRDSTAVTISATSSGGGFGSTSDSDTIRVSDGGTYSVNLYI